MKLLKWITGSSLGGNPELETLRSIRPLLLEAHGLIKAEEHGKSREILLRALEVRDHINSAETVDWMLTSLASTWISQEKFDDQAGFFSDYINRHPGDASAYCCRAMALWYSGRLKEAAEDYSRAIELQPADLLSRSGRGQVLAELGDQHAATRDLEMALRLLTDTSKLNEEWIRWCRDAEAFVRRGRAVALAGSGQIREAMNEFDRSATLNPNNAWVYYSRARVYDRLGDGERALADYTSSLEKNDPRLTPLQRTLARERADALRR